MIEVGESYRLKDGLRVTVREIADGQVRFEHGMSQTEETVPEADFLERVRGPLAECDAEDAAAYDARIAELAADGMPDEEA